MSKPDLDQPTEQNWASSLDRQKTRLEHLGFASLEDYLASPLWTGKQQEYFADPHLVQACMLCGSKQFGLVHQGDDLGREDVSELLPLCQSHEWSLEQYLLAHWLPKEDSLDSLLHCAGWTNPTSFNRLLLKYRRGILGHRLAKLDLDCEICKYRTVGAKQKRSMGKDHKLVTVSDRSKRVVKRFSFNAATGEVRLSFKGRPLSFDHFAGNLKKFLNRTM